MLSARIREAAMTAHTQRWLPCACWLMVMMAACADPPVAPQLPAAAQPLAGQGRIWFYRDWQPSESLNLANIEVNGSYFGSVANGGAFYRDVPPGRYRIAPASFVPNSMQDLKVELAPGQQAYVKIVSLSAWGSGNTAARDIERDAFWAWLIPPQTAQAELA